MMQCSKVSSRSPARSECGPVNRASPRTTSTPRVRAMPASPPVSCSTTARLPADQPLEVDRRRAEVDAVRAHLLRLGDHPRGVQQRLGRDAADVQADAAQALVALDEDRAQAEVGGAERGGVAADAPADDDHVGVVGGLGGRPASGARPPAGGGSAPDGSRSRTSSTSPSETRSPSVTRSSETVPANGAGTSIVALSDSRVTSGSSALTAAPGATWISITGTSVKSPMSGTGTSARAHSRTRRRSESTRTR